MPIQSSMKQFAVYESLLELGYEPIIEKVVLTTDGKQHKVDMVLEDLSIAIEYDGIYWHNSEANVTRDKAKSESLIQSGWKVIRMRECNDRSYLPPLGIDSFHYCEMVCTYKAEGEHYDLDIRNLHGAIKRVSAVPRKKMSATEMLPDSNGKHSIRLNSVPDVSTALLQARIAAGMSQLEAADEADINRTYLSRMETGEISLSYMERVLELMKVYGVTMTVSFDSREKRNASSD